jgi:hypothetical protein
MPAIRATIGPEDDGFRVGLSPRALELIRRRLACGYYSRPEVVEEIARRILRLSG